LLDIPDSHNGLARTRVRPTLPVPAFFKALRMRSIVNINQKLLRDKCHVTFYGILLFMMLSACSNGQNFSQLPGFRQHFSAYPPSDVTPSAPEVALLKKYKPRIFSTDKQLQPIDFYQDYIAHGTLYVDGKKVSQKPTATLLNEYRDTPGALFKYEGNYKQPGTSVVYARVDYEQTSHQGQKYDFTFLTYNLVFPVSGILQGLGKLQSIGLAIVGNLNDWHQLDHYVNVSVALLDSKPVAMTLQQHNYQTTPIYRSILHFVPMSSTYITKTKKPIRQSLLLVQTILNF